MSKNLKSRVIEWCDKFLVNKTWAGSIVMWNCPIEFHYVQYT